MPRRQQVVMSYGDKDCPDQQQCCDVSNCLFFSQFGLLLSIKSKTRRDSEKLPFIKSQHITLSAYLAESHPAFVGVKISTPASTVFIRFSASATLTSFWSHPVLLYLTGCHVCSNVQMQQLLMETKACKAGTVMVYGPTHSQQAFEAS